MLRQLSFILVGLFLSQGSVLAQDPIFSQFYASPLQINPAFAGVTYAPRISLNYRNQWGLIDGGFETYAATYEQSVEALNSGFGLMLMTDNIGNGLYRTSYASAVYGYKVQLGREFFAKFGLEAGLIQNRLDWDRLVFPDQLDPILGGQDAGGNPFQSEEQRPDALNRTTFDVSAGILLYSSRFYGGLSAKHLNRPDENLLDLNTNLTAGRPLRLTFHAGAEFNLTTRNNGQGPAFISPNIVVISQGPFGQINGGAYAGFGKFYGGAWYRHTLTNPDAGILLIGFREGAFRIGYSYDLTLSKLASAPGGAGGTHEISLTINFDDTEQVRNSRRRSQYNDCFKMFN